jgi:hypothetical protein
MERDAALGSHVTPGQHRIRDQLGDVDLLDPANVEPSGWRPASRAREVFERQRGSAQLELHRPQPVLLRLRHPTPELEPEPDGGQRAPQLVTRSPHGLHLA